MRLNRFDFARDVAPLLSSLRPGNTVSASDITFPGIPRLSAEPNLNFQKDVMRSTRGRFGKLNLFFLN